MGGELDPIGLAESLRALQARTVVRRQGLEHESARLAASPGAESLRVRQLKEQIVSTHLRTASLELEIAAAEVGGEQARLDEWILHGHVFSADSSPVPNVTASLLDESGQWLSKLGYEHTDEHGYFKLAVGVPDQEKESTEQRSPIAALPGPKVRLRITDAKKTQLWISRHDDLTLSAGGVVYRAIVLDPTDAPGAVPESDSPPAPKRRRRSKSRTGG